MDWYEPEVQALETAFRRDQPDPGTVVFYGSSSIRLWTNLAEDFRDTRVVNLGFGGSTLEACAWFFQRLVPPWRPRAVVCYAGDNDLGDGQEPEAVIDSFRMLLRQVDTRLGAIPFTFLAIKPSPARLHLMPAIRRVNATVRHDLIRQRNRYYVDIFSLMLDAAGRPRADLYDDDGLHLSPAGYRLWARVLQAYRPAIF